MLSSRTLSLLFSIGILIIISTGWVNYIHLENKRIHHYQIQESFSITNFIQNLEKILLHDHLHSENGSSSHEADVILDSLSVLIDSIKFNEIKALAQERIDYLQEGTIQEKTNSRRLQKFIEEKKKVNLSKLRTTLKELKTKELNKISQLKDNSAKADLFATYSIIGGFIVSILIFISVFLIQRNSGKWISEQNEDKIPYEELERIIRDRTEEISAINLKLNRKIDEIKKIDESLKRSEKYYRTLFEQTHDAIMIISPDSGHILDVNKRASEIYGFSKEEFSSISLDLISKNPIECKAKINEILSKGHLHNFQCVHYTKNMREILVEINASLIEYNNSLAILAINRDITDKILKVITN